jgi:glutamate-5-semialdehyde dehydrogenase
MTKDSVTSVPNLMVSVQRTYEASLVLGSIKGVERSNAVRAMADALDEAIDDILEANTLDLEASREMAVPELILEWLKLTPERLNNTVETFIGWLSCLTRSVG